MNDEINTVKRKTTAGKPLIVGVGASAGGLEAFQDFLSALDHQAGLAIVFVQHRESGREELLIPLLTDHTRMPIVGLADSTRLKPNTVYVAPPQSILELVNGQIRIVENDDGMRPKNVIDHFFHSLAEDQNLNAAGVILSGTGSDGILGLKAIGDAGGVTFAQDPKSARYDAMPRSAAITGLADHVLPPREIAIELVKYAGHAGHIDDLSESIRSNHFPEQILPALPAITELLLTATGHNFQHYKTSTLARRIQRRMQVAKISAIDDYVALLAGNSGEAQSLFRELFMVVFQDSGLPHGRNERSSPEPETVGHGTTVDAYDAKSVVQQLESELIATRSDLETTMQEMDTANEELKSSNEELLSMNEEMQSANEELETSKEEIRSANNALDQTNSDLKNLLRSTQIATIFLDNDGHILWFTPAVTEIFNLIATDTGRLLSNITHNLVEMPPLSIQAVVSAAEKIIEHEIQSIDGRWFLRRVLPYLRDERPDGLITSFIDVTEQKRIRIRLETQYQIEKLLVDAKSFGSVIPDVLDSIRTTLNADFSALWLVDPGSDSLVCAEMSIPNDRPLLEDFARETEQIRFRKGKGLPGRVWQMLEPAWIEDIARDRGFERKNLHLDIGLNSAMAMPIMLGSNFHGVIEVFTAVPTKKDQMTLNMLRSIGNEIGQFIQNKRLDEELRDRESRQAAFLQSSLDPIVTMNIEGQIVDFNPAAEQTFGHSRRDVVGRSLAETIIPEEFREAHTEGMARYLATGESRVIGRRIEMIGLRSDGSRFPVELSINATNTREGVPFFTATLRDITEQKRLATVLLDREAHLRRVIDNTTVFIGVLGIDGTVLEVNEPALHIADLGRDAVVGQKFWDTYWFNYDLELQARLRSMISRASSGERVREDLDYRVANDQRRIVDYSINPVWDANGKVMHLVASGFDIVDRVASEKTLADTLERLDLSMEFSGVAPWSWNIQTNDVISDGNLDRLFGFDVNAEPTLNDFMQRIDEKDRSRIAAAVEKSVQNGEAFEEEFRINASPGEVRWIRASGRVRKSPDGAVEDFLGVVSDITNRKLSEIETSDREAHLRRVINNQLGLVGVIDRNSILLEVDDQSLSIAGLTREDVIGKHFAECGWWTYDPAVSEKMRDSMNRAFAGEIVRYDVPLYAHGDQRLMIDFMIAPVRNEQGEVEYLIPSGVDISARVQSEDENRATAGRLEAIFNTAVDGIITIDRKGTINSANPAAVRIFDYAADELLGRNVKMLMPETYHSEHDSYLATLLKTRGPEIIGSGQEVCGRRRDGSTFPLGLAVSETNLEGKHRFVGIFRDISDQKSSEETIRESEVRLAMALKAGGMAAWEWRPDSSFWTDEMFELLRIPRQNKPDFDLLFKQVHPEDRTGFRVAWQRAVDGQDSYEHEFRIVRPDGHIRWLVGVGHCVEDSNGTVTRIFGMNWDSTQDHLTTEALRLSERRAHEASLAKSEFLANMSHEIRTPMTAVLGYADLMLAKVYDQETLEHLRTIRRNGTFLLEIINDILDLSKIEAGKLEIERKWFAPHKVVRDIVTMMKVRADEKGLKFVVEYDGLIPATIDNDSRRLKQILVNLIGNAIKFTDSGSIQLNVRYLPRKKPKIQFDIVDTGIGMTGQQLERLFQPFSQGDASVTRSFGGTGLGLAISRRLARILGGDVKVSSEPDKGSTFSCTIATGDVSQAEMIQPKPESIMDSVDGNVSLKELDCRVLVVDDRRDVRLLTKTFLTRAGAAVELAEDGQFALERIRASIAGDAPPIDLMLLDMQMPRLDGYQTAIELRKMGFLNPIIALTADAMHGDMKRCIDCGCNAYLSKPIDSNELINTIHRYINE